MPVLFGNAAQFAHFTGTEFSFNNLNNDPHTQYVNAMREHLDHRSL